MRYKQEQASCEIILLKGSGPNDLARHGMHLARLRYTPCNLMATDLTFFLCPCMWAGDSNWKCAIWLWEKGRGYHRFHLNSTLWQFATLACLCWNRCGKWDGLVQRLRVFGLSFTRYLFFLPVLRIWHAVVKSLVQLTVANLMLNKKIKKMNSSHTFLIYLIALQRIWNNYLKKRRIDRSLLIYSLI